MENHLSSGLSERKKTFPLPAYRVIPMQAGGIMNARRTPEREAEGGSGSTQHWIQRRLALLAERGISRSHTGLADAIGRLPSAVSKIIAGGRRIKGEEIAPIADYLLMSRQQVTDAIAADRAGLPYPGIADFLQPSAAGPGFAGDEYRSHDPLLDRPANDKAEPQADYRPRPGAAITLDEYGVDALVKEPGGDWLLDPDHKRDSWSFGARYAREVMKLVLPEAAFVLIAPDNAMAPDIQAGDRLVVDRARSHAGAGGYFVVSLGGEITIRHIDLTERDGVLRVERRHPTRSVATRTDEDLDVIGRVASQVRWL